MWHGLHARMHAFLRWITLIAGSVLGIAVLLWGACPGGVVGRGGAAASGDVGQVTVYGQTASGPVALRPGTLHRLRRPQELAFRFEVEGTGTRDVRIEAELPGGRRVLHEERRSAPTRDYLGFTLALDERAPDAWTLVVVVEPPHALNLVTRYPLRLVGDRAAREIGSEVDSR
jgi:hypothetical protein